MKAAIDGSEEAYNQLLENAAQAILLDVGLDTDQFYSDRDNIQTAIEYLTGQEFDDIEVGAELNDANFLAGLENIVNASGMTAQQATDYLAAMGVDAEVIEDTSRVRDIHQYTGAKPTIEDNPFPGTDPATGAPMTYHFPTVTYETVPS
jgi:hypothetical protein